MANNHRYRIDDDGRECITCKDYKLWGEFNIDKHRSHGRTPMCKPCRVIENRNYRNRTHLEGFNAKINDFCLKRL